MSYTKTNWVNGETPINATNLNKIENQLESNTNAIDGEVVTSGDFNDLVDTNTEGNTTKYYIQSTSMANQPASVYGWLTSYYQSANTQVQIFVANDGVIYERKKSGGTWNSWTKIEVEDTGWVDMSSYVNTTYFTIRSGTYKPMARRIGNRVYWRGEVYCSTAPSGYAATLLTTDIPSKFLPDYQYSFCGVTFQNNQVYNMFISSAEGIRVSQTSFSVQSVYTGYQLSNLNGYLID